MKWKYSSMQKRLVRGRLVTKRLEKMRQYSWREVSRRRMFVTRFPVSFRRRKSFLEGSPLFSFRMNLRFVFDVLVVDDSLCSLNSLSLETSQTLFYSSIVVLQYSNDKNVFSPLLWYHFSFFLFNFRCSVLSRILLLLKSKTRKPSCLLRKDVAKKSWRRSYIHGSPWLPLTFVTSHLLSS